jgi:hypothetical protein
MRTVDKLTAVLCGVGAGAGVMLASRDYSWANVRFAVVAVIAGTIVGLVLRLMRKRT